MFMRYNTVSREELMAAAGKIGTDGHLHGHLADLEPAIRHPAIANLLIILVLGPETHYLSEI